MKILSLFAGIGGLDLGLEAAIPGAHVVAQVEIEPYCRAVLAKHWPDADRSVHDVRLAHRLYATPAGRTFVAGALPSVDLVCGGFPCQDLSTAGKGAGLDGERSGLWWQVWRLVRDLRPRFVVLENVAALLVRGLDVVLGALAGLGYDAEWAVFGADDVGAPHRRRRIAIIAYLPNADGEQDGQPERITGCDLAALAGLDGTAEPVADTDADGREGFATGRCDARVACRGDVDGCGAGAEDVEHARALGCLPWGTCGDARPGAGVACRADVGYRALAYHPPAWWGCDDADGECRPFDLLGLLRDGWPTERGLGGDPDGLPAWLDAAAWEAGVPRVAPSTSTTRPRLAGCGNAVVPQWAYEVGQRVLHHMEHTRHASR